MASPETRQIFQCVHTAIQPRGGESARPFAKLAMLTTVFTNALIARRVLDRLRAMGAREVRAFDPTEHTMLDSVTLLATGARASSAADAAARARLNRDPRLAAGPLGAIPSTLDPEAQARPTDDQYRAPAAQSGSASAVDPAARAILDGDVQAATGMLRTLAYDEVADFAGVALTEERAMIERARLVLLEYVDSTPPAGIGDSSASNPTTPAVELRNATAVAPLRPGEVNSLSPGQFLTNLAVTVGKTFAGLLPGPVRAVIEGPQGAVTGGVPAYAPAVNNDAPATSPSALGEIRPPPELPATISLVPVADAAALFSAIGLLPPGVVQFSRAGLRALVASPNASYLRNWNRRQQALRGLERDARIEPVGFLALERVELTPVGYARGELVYSLALTPGEIVRVSHREWSRSESEFTQLIATSLETATEDAISEKSELTESTQVQRQHSDSFSASASASGGFGAMFSFSASATGSIASTESSTTAESAHRTREATSKASSRAMKEHKVTFRLATTTEVEDTTYREIRNDSIAPVRWDFHRLVKKWEVSLYRYGARMTYDIVIPEPGSYLLRRYLELSVLEGKLADSPAFPVLPSQITDASWSTLRDTHAVPLEPPPPPTVTVFGSQTVTYLGQPTQGVGTVDLSAPGGYELVGYSFLAYALPSFRVNDSSRFGDLNAPRTYTGFINEMDADNKEHLNKLTSATSFVWRFMYRWQDAQQGETAGLMVQGLARRTATLYQEWQSRCFDRLRDAWLARRDDELQRLARRRDEIRSELEGMGALNLRRLEREELMKGVLRWLLGPDFNFYPNDLPDLDTAAGDLASYDPSTGSVRATAYEASLRHGAAIRFLHQAIEWENMNYVLYPYFWTDHDRWDIKQRLQHADDLHWSFLRAGAARIVLTIRRGFENPWLVLVENGFDAPEDAKSPYLEIASEIENEANAYQPQTATTNPTKGLTPIDTWFEHTPTGALDVSAGTTLA